MTPPQQYRHTPAQSFTWSLPAPPELSGAPDCHLCHSFGFVQCVSRETPRGFSSCHGLRL